MSRETRKTSLYDAHKKPVELDRSNLPSFRKISCHSITDDGVAITAVTNNSTHSQSEKRAWPQRSVVREIPPISFESSLPSSSGPGRGGRGRGGKKRPNLRPPLLPAKRGRGSQNSRNNARASSSTVSDFDNLLFESRQRRLAPPTSAPPTSGGRGGGDSAEVYEIPDSPPPSLPPSLSARESASPTPSSSSSNNDLNAVQFISRLQEEATPPSQADPPTSTSSSTTLYTSAQVLSATHTLTADKPKSQGHPTNQPEEGVAPIDVDAEEDCRITDATSSRYFNQRGRNPPSLPPSTPPAADTAADSLAATEEELLQFRKTSANFNRATCNLPQLIIGRSPSLSLSRSPTSLVLAIEDFNKGARGQSSDVGGAKEVNSHGNDREPTTASNTSSLPAPRLTDPALDGGRGGELVMPAGATGNTRWAGRGGGEGREGGRSVFDFIESSSNPNTKSFYGGGGARAPSYGQQQVMAARDRNKKRLSLRDTLRGRQPPLIKLPHTAKELDFTSTGKTLMSVQDQKRRQVTAAQSSNRSTHLSMVEEVHLDIGSARIGTLEEIPVSHCLLSSGEISLKLVAKDTPLRYTIYFSDISEWKMNLGESPRCVMIRVHPLVARKLANRLRSQFKLTNQRFLHVESRNRWDWYWFLKIDQEIGPDTVARVHQWVDQLESRQEELKVKVQREMSGEEVRGFLGELGQQQTVSLFSSTPSEVYRPSSASFRDREFVRRSSRIQSKESQRGRDVERLRRFLNEEGEEEEEGEVTCIPSGDPKKILLTYKPEGTRVNIEISEMDLDCLEPSIYLNDRVIDFYLMYLWYDMLETGLRERVHIFSSFFHHRLMDSTRDLTGSKDMSVAKRLHDRVKSWTRHVDLFAKEYIILPVCVRSHWLLALICHPGQFTPPPTPSERRRKPRPRPKVLRNTRSRAKQEGEEVEKVVASSSSAIELISINYSQEEEGEEKGEGEGEGEGEDMEGPLQERDDCSQEREGDECAGFNVHLSSCEEDELLGVRDEERVGGGEDMEVEVEGETKREEGESSQTPEGEGEGDPTSDKKDKKPCIMILDSLEIRRGAIVTRINNYLSEEWETKRKDCPPLKFKLRTVYPKLLPQNNSCDCGVFVLQYVESLFQCLQEGLPPPSMPDEWASYHQTQGKRQELKKLITSLGERQSHAQSPPTSCQSHTPSSPTSPELVNIPLDAPPL